MSSPESNPDLGTILVIGGTGFIGTHVVQAFLDDPAPSSVHVLSRTAPPAPKPNVSYHQGNMIDSTFLQSLISTINPRVILNLAYPGHLAKEKVLREVVVVGTTSLIKIAVETPSVEALVYTSTAEVAKKLPGGGVLTEENSQVWTEKDKTNHYFKSKAIGETMVLSANCQKLRTLSLRVPGLYGEGHNMMIDNQLKTMRAGQHKIQLGNNDKLFEFIYVKSAAHAHVLAAKALLRGKQDPQAPKVDGEAFFISDGEPRPFWDIGRSIWKAAGDTTTKEDVKVIPFWVVFAMAAIGEWFYWLFTFGTKEPELRTADLKYMSTGTVFSIDKAKERLGYAPLVSQEEGIQRSVKWALEHEGENTKQH